MTTKLDLDDLERKAKRRAAARALAAPDPEWFRATGEYLDATQEDNVLAMIARIRELEAGQAECDRVNAASMAEIERLEVRAAAADKLEVEMAKLLPMTDAAVAFVDQQGTLAQGDFAGDLFDDLARALEAAGR